MALLGVWVSASVFISYILLFWTSWEERKAEENKRTRAVPKVHALCWSVSRSERVESDPDPSLGAISVATA